MSDTQTNAPSHHVYHVRKGDGDKRFYTKIGAAWTSSDNKGFNVTLESVPLNGKISLRIPEEKTE